VFVAPAIDAQLAPAPSHRLHWSAKLMGVVPDHEPVPATSVCAVLAVPEIVGGEVFTGAACGWALPLSGRSRAVIAAAASATAVT
jgi:hypothetical protein